MNSWEADNPFCDNSDESPINIDLDGDIQDSDNCVDTFDWQIEDHSKFSVENNGHSISIVESLS